MLFRSAEGDRGEIVVSEAIRLAKNLGMRTVAEGVEDEKQVKFLAEQKCDMIQGFFYAKPMPKDDYVSLILRFHRLVNQFVEQHLELRELVVAGFGQAP